MRAYVANTDWNWFNFLRNQQGIQEVNFWQPGGKVLFKALQPGELFLFKLKSPYNCIVGGGIFAHSSLIPISLAWESFGRSNGARTLPEMRALIEKLKKIDDTAVRDYTIGCILLEQPFFLSEESWIPVPNWNSNIVQGKIYDLAVEPGLSILHRLNNPASLFTGVKEERPQYGEPVIVKPRLGQGSFRIMVTDVYERRCAVTGEKTLPALDAAHIKPFAESGEHSTPNGILLRRDIHALFDQGYVTINPSMIFEVSRRIKEEFENGREYYKLHGAKIHLPANPLDQPDKSYLEWHNSIYKG